MIKTYSKMYPSGWKFVNPGIKQYIAGSKSGKKESPGSMVNKMNTLPIKEEKLSFFPYLGGIGAYIYFLNAFPLDSSTHHVIYAIGVFLALWVTDLVGKRYCLLELMIFLAYSQWILVPILLENLIPGSTLAVPEEEFLSFVVPGTVAMVLGFYLPLRGKGFGLKEVVYRLKEHLSDKPNVGFILIMIGFLGIILQRFVPGALQYFVYLMRHLIFLGALYALFSSSKSRFLQLGIVFFFILSYTISSGTFTEFFWWSIFFSLFIFSFIRINLFVKLTCAGIALISLLILQSVKYEYRLRVWDVKNSIEAEGSKPEIFLDLVSNTLENPDVLFSNYAYYGALTRGNIGGHVSHIMNHMPENEPFTNGETVIMATLGAFVPRLLWPNKPIAGGEHFERFTGLELNEGTSMGYGPIGEAYANFGPVSGVIFMFVFGAIIAFIIATLGRKMLERPTYILWLPYYFYSAIRMENDVNSVFNQWIKITIFILLLNWGFNKVLKMKL